MKLRSSRLSNYISASQIVKVFLALAYTVICAVIIIPRIDHQPWYPEVFRTYDLPAGLDFSPYNEVTVNLSSLKLNSNQKNALLKILWERIKASRITDADMYIENNTLTIHVPQDTSFQAVALLLMKGSLEILTPSDPEKFKENPILAYDKANYTDSGLKLSQISSAEFKQEADQFSYIDLSIQRNSRDKWNKYATAQSTSNIGLSIDGQMFQSWMLPASNTPNPTFVVALPPTEARIIASLLVSDPLPFELTLQNIEKKELKSENTLFQMYVLLAGCITVGILLRRVLLRERLVATIGASLTIAGIVAMLKISSIPVTTELFIALILFLSLFLGLRTKLHFPAYVLASIAGLFLTLSSHPALFNTGHMLIITGLFGTLSTFFYEFINIYEEK